jgi:hypothetical protein
MKKEGMKAGKGHTLAGEIGYDRRSFRESMAAVLGCDHFMPLPHIADIDPKVDFDSRRVLYFS